MNGEGLTLGQRKWLVLLVVAVTVLLGIAISRHIASRASLNDDDLDFYYNALSIEYPQGFDKINAEVSAKLADLPLSEPCHCSWAKFRYDLRAAFRNHYILYSYLIDGVRHALMPITRGAGMDYATSVGVYLVATYYLSFILALTLMALAILGVVRLDLAIAFAIAVPLMLLVREYSPILPGFWELRIRPSGLAGWLEWWRSAAFLLISPSSTFVGFFPRGLAMFLMMGVFLMRWSGADALAYASLAIIAGLHGGTGMLVLLTLLMTDAALHSDKFGSPPIVTGMVVAFSPLALPHGIMGKLTGISWWGLPALAAVIAVVLLADRVLRTSQKKPLVIVNKSRERLVSLGSIPADIIAIGVLWFAWSLVSVIMYIRIYQPDAIYTWGDLPARYLMAFRGPVYVGVVAIVIGWSLKRVPLGAMAGLGLVSCAAVSWLMLFPGNYVHGAVQFAKSLDHYERMLGNIQAAKAHKYDEGLTYYAASKSLETNTDLVTPVIRSVAWR